MNPLSALFARAAFILLAIFSCTPVLAQDRTRNSEPDTPPTLEACKTCEALVARVEALEKLAGVTPDVPGTRPTRPRTRPDTKPRTRQKTRPDTRPKKEPRTNPGAWPVVGETRVSFKPTGGNLQRLSFSTPRADSWAVEEGWRFCVMRRKLAGALFILTYEQFQGFDATRVTAALVNGFPHRGAVVFDSYSVRTGGALIYRVQSKDSPGADAVQVRGTLARRSVIGPDAARIEAYEHIEPVQGYPEWVPELCAKGLAQNTAKAKKVGIYNVWDPQVSGLSSLNGSHGGWKVAPWHFGPEGWQRGSRAGYMWAEAAMFGTMDRSPLASFDPETLHPLNQHTPYWCGRANSPIPGLKPDLDPSVTYLKEHEYYEAHGSSHGRRSWGHTAMIAPFDVFARIKLVEHDWHDTTLWMDGKPDPYHHFQTIKQVQEILPPHIGWQEGGRGFAHSITSFLYAEPYFAPEKRGDLGSGYTPWLRDSDGAAWRPALRGFLAHITRPNGIIHIQPGNDGKHTHVKRSTRAREVDLLYPNLFAFGLTEQAAACRKTMQALNGQSVSEAFDGTKAHWSFGTHSDPNYAKEYDLIRGEYEGWNLPFLLSKPRYDSPNEQLISNIPPAKVFEVVGAGK